MGTNATDTYEEHCQEMEHPDDKEGMGDQDGMREMKTVSEKFIKYLQLGCPIKLSVAQL